MKARLRLLPFDQPLAEYEITERCTVTELLKLLDANEEFYTDGRVLLGAHELYKDKWPVITLDPSAYGYVDLCVVPGNKSTAILIASVALAVTVAAISGGILGPAGFGLLGASFAAGGLGASLAAAGVGLAGAYALGQLTALPSSSQTEGATHKALNQAGITGNALRPDELLPVIIGEIGYSPPQISRAYTTWESNSLTVHGIFGVEGRCLISDIKINGTAITELEDVEYETREGSPGDTPLTVAQLICIQEQGAKLSQHDTELVGLYNDQLKDQVTPANSLPVFHYFSTKGVVDEMWIRLIFPGGMSYSLEAIKVAINLRIEIREKGTLPWRNMPSLTIYDDLQGAASLRVEVKIKIGRPANGPLWGHARLEYPIYNARDVQGNGQAWEYEADAYFNIAAPTDVIPVMTSGTTSGVTITDSTNIGAAEAGWKAADSNATGTYWTGLLVNLPATLTVDFGSGNTKTVKSFKVGSVSAGNTLAVRAGYLDGSNNGTDWTLLSTVDDKETATLNVYGFVRTPAAFRFYRFTVTRGNGDATWFRMPDFQLYETDGFMTNFATGAPSLAHYVSLNENGADIYLDPDQGWNVAEYEVRVKRGYDMSEAQYASVAATDSINGSVTQTNFFGYYTSSGFYVVLGGPRYFRTECQIELFSSVSHDVPVNTSGIACIAIAAKNMRIDSVYAKFKSYASEYDGAVWGEIQVPTSNPAALYRAVLLGYANADPAPGEVLQQDVLEDWFDNCVTAGHECNMVVSGQVIRDVKQIIATCGMASPRDSNELGIIEDRDTSAEPPRNPLTPANSKNLGSQIILPDLPHGVRVEFFDEANDYKITQITIFRDGFNSDNAILYETRRYPGYTSEAKVTERAIFDLRQLQYRAKRYIREVGIEGLNFERGQLSSINDDVLEVTQAAGWIKSIQTSGPNIISITLTNVMPWGRAQGDMAEVDDVTALTDVLDVDVPMGIFIRDDDGNEIYKEVSDVTDSNVCTFVTPFANDGTVKVDQMVGAGKWGNLERRVKLIAKRPKAMDKWLLELADEARDLFPKYLMLEDDTSFLLTEDSNLILLE